MRSFRWHVLVPSLERARGISAVAPRPRTKPSPAHILRVEKYLRANQLYRTYAPDEPDPVRGEQCRDSRCENVFAILDKCCVSSKFDVFLLPCLESLLFLFAAPWRGSAGSLAQVYSGDLLELDLATIVPCVSGPKRPHDMVPVAELKSDFLTGLTAPVRGQNAEGRTSGGSLRGGPPVSK